MSPWGKLSLTSSPMLSIKQKILFYLITLLLSIIVLELGCYLLSFWINQNYIYQPPSRTQFKNYFSKNYDKRLGWGSVGAYRLSPAGKDLETPYVSLYGDSFTFGFGVSEAEAWGNILTTLISRRVDNYGYAGYGTDQAYLSFLYNKADRAKIVILCHSSENIVRNINQERNIIYPEKRNTILLKPRFITNGQGNLTLVPIPELTPSDYNNYIREMQNFLTAEYFLPNHGPLTKKTIQFPYLVSIPYLVISKKLYLRLLPHRGSTRVADPPWFAQLYDPQHPSQALQVTRDIMLNFVKVAKQRDKMPILIILPIIQDLEYYQHTGDWIYSPLIESLANQGVYAYNMGEPLLQKVQQDEIYDYFSTCKKARAGHYTAQGNRVLAEVVGDLLIRDYAAGARGGR